MARKTNFEIKGKSYYRIRRKVGMRKNRRGEWVPDYKLFYGASKKEAEQKYQEYIKGYGIDKETSLGQAMDQYIKNVFIPDGSLKDSTKDRYISAWNYTLKENDLSGKALANIKTIDLQEMYNNLSCAPSSVRALNKLISRLYKFLLREGVVMRDITAGISLPKVEQKTDPGAVEVWDPEELKKILKESKGHRLHFLFVLAAGSGLRISELLALRNDDIEDGCINVKRQLYRDPVFNNNGDVISRNAKVRELKTGTSRRSVPLQPEIIRELEIYRKWQREDMLKNGYRTDYLFTSSTGSLYDHSSLDKTYRRFCKKIGVTPRGFHVFRHTFASRLASAGVPIQTVSALLGHSGINVTQKYYLHISSQEKRAAVDKLDIL